MINVFIVVGREYHKEGIVDILIEEAYLHNFVFGSNFTNDEAEEWEKLMLDCDEIWIFGTTNRNPFDVCRSQHSFALKNNLDIWVMG